MADDAFVLDCSVTLSWCFLDERDAYALDVLRSLRTRKGLVPALWPLEVANGLLMGERRKRSAEANTAHWLQSLSALPIEIDQRSLADTFRAVAPLARAHTLTSYDASYLELALRRGLPFATMDERLKAVAKLLGLKLYEPGGRKRRR